MTTNEEEFIGVCSTAVNAQVVGCINLMAERRKLYGDKWKENKEYQMMGLIAEKFKRLEHQFENKTKDSYESKEDTLIDIVNWSLFYLYNLQEGKYEE